MTNQSDETPRQRVRRKLLQVESELRLVIRDGNYDQFQRYKPLVTEAIDLILDEYQQTR